MLVKSYIAHTAETEESDYYSVFCSLKGSLRGFGSLEVWSNLSRITNKIESSSLFLWYKQQLMNNVTMAVKFATVYQGSSDDKYRPVLSLELNSRL